VVGLVVVVVLRIGAETFEARGEVRIRRRYNRKHVLALAFVVAFVDRAHDRSQDTRVHLPCVAPKPRLVLARLKLVVILLEEERGCC